MYRRRSRSRLWVRPLEERAMPATFTVLNTLDAGAGSLRQAVLNANNTVAPDTIVFDATAFASPQTITLTSGQISIADTMSVVGPAARVTISGNNTSRIFNIDVPGMSGQAVTISGLTLSNGNATSDIGGALLNNDEFVTLNAVFITNCSASVPGGGIGIELSTGSVTMNNCFLTSNSGYGGGAIFATNGASLSLTDCKISGNNSFNYSGGAIFLKPGGSLTIIDSTISGNTAGYAGGLMLYGTTVVRNCTVSDNNSGGAGGGIAIFNATLTIQNSTIAFNSATTSGGGINNGNGSTINLASTIVANNTAPSGPDIAGAVTANFSLISNTAGGTITGGNNKLNVDPLLGPLANNGGPTLTHQPLSTSPCVNAGSNPANLNFDQRGLGFPRISYGATDIGAVQRSPIPVVAASATNVLTAGATSHQIKVIYGDDTGIDVSSLGDDDIIVNGPNGPIPVTFTSVDVNTNGTPRTATYTMVPPGGSWDGPDTGIYWIVVQPNAVFDIDTPTPNAVPSGRIGSFSVQLSTTFVVSALNDETTDTDFKLSLREALALAYQFQGTADTITFSPALVSGGDATIPLMLFDSGLDSAGAGPSALIITKPITITGPSGDNGITIARSAAANFRLFHVRTGGNLTLEYLTLSGGVAAGFSGGAGASAGMGGAIFNQGTLTIRNSLLMNNLSQGGSGGTGGAIGGSGLGAVGGVGQGSNGGGPNGGVGAYGYPVPGGPHAATPGGFGGGGGAGWDGSYQLTHGLSAGAGGFGGGGGTGGVPDFINGVVPGADGGAGGFGGGGGRGRSGGSGDPSGVMGAGGFGGGAATAARAGGGAGMGGAIFSTDGTVIIVNSTLTNNSAFGGAGGNNGQGLGGAIFSRNGSVTVTSCTLANNTASDGGGSVYIVQDGVTASITLNNSILAKTVGAATDFSSNGTITSAGSGNLIQTNSGFTGGIVASGDPLLGTLADHGGPTLTYDLNPNSRAINLGNDALIGSLTTDQRGGTYNRRVGSHIDIGAFESDSQGPAAVGSAANVSVVGATSQTITVTYFDELAIDVGTLKNTNITINGPTGTIPVTFTGVDFNTNGTPRVATYTMVPPGGYWNQPDNGTYLITMNANEVFDTDSPTSHAVPAAVISTFTVNVSISATPSAVGSANNVTVGGATTHTVTVTYSDDLAIDVNTLGNDDIVIKGPLGSLPVSFVGVDLNTNGTPRTATYSFTPPGGSWDGPDTGVYAIFVNPNAAFDADPPTPHAVPAGSIGSFIVALPQNLIVNALNDESTDTDGKLSLREAVNLANQYPSTADTITFDPTLVTAGSATIPLSLYDPGLTKGFAGPSAFIIDSPMTIIGPSGNRGISIARSSAANFRLFDVTTAGNLTLQYLTLTGGVARGGDGAYSSGGAAGLGGAVFNQGALTLSGVTIAGNTAQGGSGAGSGGSAGGGGGGSLGGNGVYGIGGGPNGGSAGANGYGVSAGMGGAGGFGGGGGGGGGAQYPYNAGKGGPGGFGGGGGAGGSGDSVFPPNTNVGGPGGFGGGGGGTGGGNSTLSFAVGGFGGGRGNFETGGSGAGLGGAIFSLLGAVVIVNSTFVSNTALGGPMTSTDATTAGQGLGGAIFVHTGSTTIQNCTICRNTAAQGGGGIFAYGGSFKMDSTILANSANGATDFQSVNGSSLSGTANLLMNNAASPNGFPGGIVTSADPMLGPLVNNGGPTRTFALLPGSPCINAGSNPANLTTDQRGSGFVRVYGSAADIGAYEVQAAQVQTVQINDGSAQRSRVTSLTVTLSSLLTLPGNPAAAFLLTRQSDNEPVSLNASVTGNSVTLTFGAGTAVEYGSLADGRYTLTALASKINGGNFDGNGDGILGDDYVLASASAPNPPTNIFRLFADANGDGTVSTNDFVQFRLALFSPNNIFDFDGDGFVSVNDFIQFRNRFSTSI
jgi:hypothetical protein